MDRTAELKAIVISIVIILFSSTASASDDIGGVWTKTTHPDAQNLSIFYVDDSSVKAIGYGKIAGKPAIWHAEGSIRGGILVLKYRYSPNATPDGWEPEGKMELKVSDDAVVMRGTASSKSGDWLDTVEFRRIHLMPG